METGNWAAWRFYLDVAQILATVALFIWIRVTSGQRANRDDLQALRQEVQTQDKRLSLLETHVSGFPKEEVIQLSVQVAGITSTLTAMSEQMKRLEHKQNMLIENELRGEKQ
ncbi:DUF2730 family protein [Agarivorans gilvus]|uniref:DUF2730 domain-containing protein n=1 Tax=Agarivorans gilvus TaxID=680279 RepID=A0ABQ1HXD1_9ALTE|nr:DUF2730 family protein [Agarivorans gilvus]GGA95865.1 hypothetical protein GCM10007414_05890 [Agarivorans gilvus]